MLSMLLPLYTSRNGFCTLAGTGWKPGKTRQLLDDGGLGNLADEVMDNFNPFPAVGHKVNAQFLFLLNNRTLPRADFVSKEWPNYLRHGRIKSNHPSLPQAPKYLYYAGVGETECVAFQLTPTKTVY